MSEPDKIQVVEETIPPINEPSDEEEDLSEHYSKEAQVASEHNDQNIDEEDSKKDNEEEEPKKDEVPDELDNAYPQENQNELNVEPNDDNENVSNNAQIASEHNDRMDDFVPEEDPKEKKDCIELIPTKEVNKKDNNATVNKPIENTYNSRNVVQEKQELKKEGSQESAPGEIALKSSGGFDNGMFRTMNIIKPTSASRMSTHSMFTGKSPGRGIRGSGIGFTPKSKRMTGSKYYSQMSIRSPLAQGKSPLGRNKSPLRNDINLKQGITNEEFNAMKELFRFLDVDHTGQIDSQELLILMEKLSIIMIRNKRKK